MLNNEDVVELNKIMCCHCGLSVEVGKKLQLSSNVAVRNEQCRTFDLFDFLACVWDSKSRRPADGMRAMKQFEANTLRTLHQKEGAPSSFL